MRHERATVLTLPFLFTQLTLYHGGTDSAVTLLPPLDCKSWRLNERHYGALQGLNKAETARQFGDEQVSIVLTMTALSDQCLTRPWADDSRGYKRSRLYNAYIP